MQIAQLWRYPVKSLAGERIAEAELTSDGVPGDRLVHVRGPEGVRTSRRQFRMIGLHATLGSNGRALVNGFDWESNEALELVQRAAGDDAILAEYHGVERFDVLPLLVATDGAIAEFGRDVRRLRPNIVISGVEGMAERDWEDRTLHIGDVSIFLDSLRSRCPMTTVDPDTTVRDPEVLRDIGRRFGGKLALNASVLKGGVIRIGDTATLEE